VTKNGQPSNRAPTEKREAIVRAARHVLGRLGYFGAGIDVIAAEAEVSTRTIYNKFESKEQLISAVLAETFDQVAAARKALISRYAGEVTDLESDLIELAKEWVRPTPALHDHFAIVRRLWPESDRFPQELRDVWHEAGPRRAHRTLAIYLAALGERGVLHVEDPDVSAQHFLALISDTTISRAEYGATGPEREIHEVARAGVHAFLYGYLPRATT
jgi:AcrR family transcriptional regulator